MTRRTHACLGCAGDPNVIGRFAALVMNGRTRHKDRICSRCRRRGVRIALGEVFVPLTVNYRGRGA